MRTRGRVLGTFLALLVLTACSDAADGAKSPPMDPTPSATPTPETPVFVMGSASTPRVSPDGKKVVFSVETQGDASNIATVNLADGFIEVMTTGAAQDLDPVWSPDGQTIAFNSSDGGLPTLFTVPASGGDPTPIEAGTPEMPYGFFQTYAPDGTHMAYSCATEASPVTDICIVDLATGATENITETPEITEWEPSYSPGGQLLAFASDADDPAFDIWVMKVDGSEPENLTPIRGRQADPMFSPDGKRIAFDVGAGICLIPARGGAPSCLRGIKGSYPGWSPDGKRLAYYAPVSDGGMGIWMVNVDGSKPEQVFPPTSGDGIAPA